MNIPTDSELWTRFKAGDRNAFSILYKRYFPAMYAYGSSLSIDTDYVKDAIQEVFMNLYFNNKIEIVGNSLKFYLLRAVKNKLLDILRGKRESIDISECEYTFTINFTIEDKIMEDEEYSSIPNEMKKVAAFFGKETLSECREEELIEKLPEVRKACGDRPVMRAFHFFEENKRVEEAVAALNKNDFEKALSCIEASGNSSWKYLQNTYVTGAVEEQGIPVALALTEIFLKKLGKGACRVNGGGFAGVIQTFLPGEASADYVAYMDKALGEGSAHIMKIRPVGAACINQLAE